MEKHTIVRILKKRIRWFFIIDGGFVVNKFGMDNDCMYFSVSYSLCFIKEISMDVLDEQLGAERDPQLDIN